MSESYFGACPVCERSDGYLNVGREHFFVCHTHRKKWSAGSNLFSSWREEPASLHQENAARLAAYEEVNPHYPETDQPRPKERPPTIEMTEEEREAALLASVRLLLDEAHDDTEALGNIIAQTLGSLALPNVDFHNVDLRVDVRIESLQTALRAAATLLRRVHPCIPI